MLWSMSAVCSYKSKVSCMIACTLWLIIVYQNSTDYIHLRYVAFSCFSRNSATVALFVCWTYAQCVNSCRAVIVTLMPDVLLLLKYCNTPTHISISAWLPIKCEFPHVSEFSNDCRVKASNPNSICEFFKHYFSKHSDIIRSVCRHHSTWDADQVAYLAFSTYTFSTYTIVKECIKSVKMWPSYRHWWSTFST